MYKVIENYSQYKIFYSGEVYSFRTNTFLTGAVNPDGYVSYRLTDDNGVTLTWGRHRLLGVAFIPTDEDYRKLVINHKNGIKGDDRIDNLEWATYQYNAEHAGLLGLTEKCKPVSIRNVVTGIILTFPSFIKCADYLGVTKDSISYRTSIGPERIFQDNHQYRLGHGDEPWPVVLNLEVELSKNGTSKRIEVKDLLTDEVTIYEKISDYAKVRGINQSVLTSWMKRIDQPVLPGLIQIRWFGCDYWRPVFDPIKDLADFQKTRIVVALPSLGNRIRFSSAKECADVFGIKPNTLHERLKKKGKVAYNSVKFLYEEDLIPKPK